MIPDDTEHARTYADYQAENFVARVAKIADGLRRMADEVERDGRVRDATGVGVPRFAHAAEGVLHSVIWGFAHLHVDGLIRDAAGADVAEAIAAEATS